MFQFALTTYVIVLGAAVLWLASCGAFVRLAFASVAGLNLRIRANQAILLAVGFLVNVSICLTAYSFIGAPIAAFCVVATDILVVAALFVATLRWREQDRNRRAAISRIEQLTQTCSELQSQTNTIEARCATLARSSDLTRKEEDVLVLIAKGLSYPQICEQLVLSPNSIKTHARNIYRKLGVSSKQEAIQLVEKDFDRTQEKAVG